MRVLIWCCRWDQFMEDLILFKVLHMFCENLGCHLGAIVTPYYQLIFIGYPKIFKCLVKGERQILPFTA